MPMHTSYPTAAPVTQQPADARPTPGFVTAHGFTIHETFGDDDTTWTRATPALARLFAGALLEKATKNAAGGTASGEQETNGPAESRVA